MVVVPKKDRFARSWALQTQDALSVNVVKRQVNGYGCGVSQILLHEVDEEQGEFVVILVPIVRKAMRVAVRINSDIDDAAVFVEKSSDRFHRRMDDVVVVSACFEMPA